MSENTIKAVIIDDEAAARETLRNYVGKYCPNVELLSEAFDVPSAIETIKSTQPDLVFLDVEMPFGNAFDVLEQTAGVGYDTIFISAYSEYAIQALNFSAAYYILKPVDIEELIRAVGKVTENRNNKLHIPNTQILAENMRNPGNRKIVLPTASGFEVVKVKDIVRLSGSGNYTEIFLTDGKKKVVSKVLKHFQDILEGTGFMRVHKSHIIGLEHIQAYHRGRGGMVTMTDGAEIEVSPAKKEQLLEYFG